MPSASKTGPAGLAVALWPPIPTARIVVLVFTVAPPRVGSD
jgi:hypothetical protein